MEFDGIPKAALYLKQQTLKMVVKSRFFHSYSLILIKIMVLCKLREFCVYYFARQGHRQSAMALNIF
ncbi:hypothetical protein SAMN02746098_02564 [Desulfosporosinus lacus DSM 15449]|uniref:Uncharacterized protein n=1 Tax=Desulfosporosinus lacus DSM 15449 TaxID=1121420 RepID=A0A1M5YMT6_9FIRM|nr:hypothetical protein SAMN02746098_02564 [Desulfosporosinus lacus DSM 15449]